MKKIINVPKVKIHGHDLALPRSKSGLGHYFPILEKTVEQLDSMLSYHCKVLVVRVDLHLYEAAVDNKLMSDFIRRLKKRLKSQGHKRVGYIWCREQQTSDVPHYHFALIVDANKSRHPRHLIELIEYFWETWGNVKPYTPKNCYGIIKRDNSRAYEKQFKRLSYLSKVATKDLREKTTNDYSTSRIKKNLLLNVACKKLETSISNEVETSMSNVVAEDALCNKPSPKYELDEKGAVRLKCNESERHEYFSKITGIDEFDAASKLISQAIDSTEVSKDCSADKKARSFNHVMKLMEGINPKGSVEGMLAAQMVAVHSLTMANARKGSSSEISSEFKQKYINNTVKLSRTYIAQMEALKKYRSKGVQKITVEHVTVESGGQAVVASEIIN